MYKPLFQQLQAPLGYLASGEEAMENWGNPQLQPMARRPEESFSMPMPKWSPGEFEEWKHAHTTGVPTLYGKIMQERYRRRKLPATPGTIEREDAALAQRYPNTFRPALQGLAKGLK